MLGLCLIANSHVILSAFGGADPYVHDQETWDVILQEMAAVGLDPPADPGYISDDPEWSEPAGGVGNRIVLVRRPRRPAASPAQQNVRSASVPASPAVQ